MANQRLPYQKVRRGRHQGAPSNENIFIQEISSLKGLLGQEWAKWLEVNQRAAQLWQEHQDTRAQLEKQKSLKNIFSKKEKETRLNYERSAKIYKPRNPQLCKDCFSGFKNLKAQKEKGS